MVLGGTRQRFEIRRDIDLRLAPDSSRRVRLLVLVRPELFADALANALGAIEGIEVVGRGASSGQGVALAALLVPDVILLDELVGERGGESAVHSMRNASPTAKVVVLADDPNTAAPTGTHGLLGKDAAVSEVAAAVRTVHQTGEIPMSDIDILDPIWWTDRTPPVLSERELEVLGLLCRGMANKEVATALGLSQHTIHNHVARIFNKLGAHSRLEAVSIAARDGLVNLG